MSAGLDSGGAQLVHEVPHRESLADALACVLIASRVENGDALRNQERGQRNVSSDSDIAGGSVLSDVRIGHIGAAVDSHGRKVLVSGRKRETHVRHEDGWERETLGRPEAHLLHWLWSGVGVDPESDCHERKIASAGGPAGFVIT